MSAKDDLEFVGVMRAVVERPMQPASADVKSLTIHSSNMRRLLALAERGARFTPGHEAELKAWRVADDEGRDTHKGVGDWDSWVDHARRLRALNEAGEKENER